MPGNPVGKCFCFIISVEVYTCYLLVVKPYKTPEENKDEIFNLGCVWLIVIHLLWFTDFVPEAEDRYRLGFSIVFFLIFNVIWNLSFLLVHSLKAIFSNVKAKC
jgi:hypothetical protein